MTDQKQEPDELEHSAFARSIVALVENDTDREPDLKALAELLRSDEPLDAGARIMLAELLDPKHLRFFNWRLSPTFTGARTDVIEKRRQINVMRAAIEQHGGEKQRGSVAAAIKFLQENPDAPPLPALATRSLSTLRKKMKTEDQAWESFDAGFKLVVGVLRDGLRVMSEAFSHLNDKK